jgi:hypothetical protein
LSTSSITVTPWFEGTTWFQYAVDDGVPVKTSMCWPSTRFPRSSARKQPSCAPL